MRSRNKITIVIVSVRNLTVVNLLSELYSSDLPVKVVKTITTITDAVAYFCPHDCNSVHQPDLIFMDTHLADGLSFHIFEHCQIHTPVIFISDEVKYIRQAYKNNGIGYLLKPIQPNQVMSALDKYLRLAGAFLGNPGNPNTNTPDPADKKYFIVKKGGEQVLLKKENIAYLFTEKKVLFAVDGDNRRYILEHQHLSGVSSQLNNHFYRANRKYILNINFIQKFRTINRVKILVEVALPVSQDIIISQENATEFKNWIKEI